MVNLSKTGRIFFGVAIAEIGLQAIYYRDFPYILPMPDHFPVTARMVLACIFGALFALAGASVLFERGTRQVSLLFGSLLLLIFCFYYIPYELLVSPNYMHLPDWENAEKELAFAGGAFVIAGCFPAKDENNLTRFLGKLIPAGAVLYAITIVSFGILHFMLAKQVSPFVPDWIPAHLFWIYFAGVALLGSGIAIILKIKTGLAATFLGTMIFIWFIILHIPRIFVATPDYLGAEITSAFLALAYSGIAFVIAGEVRKRGGTTAV